MEAAEFAILGQKQAVCNRSLIEFLGKQVVVIWRAPLAQRPITYARDLRCLQNTAPLTSGCKEPHRRLVLGSGYEGGPTVPHTPRQHMQTEQRC